jgi:hypothetical protein
VGAQAAERADDAAQRAVLFEHEVEADGLALDAVVHLGGRGRGHDPRQPGERIRAAIEAVQLEAEDRLALHAKLEFLRGADGQDPAVVDDGDPLAQLVRLGHVVGRQQDGPPGHRGLPGRHQLPDRSSGCHVEAERRLVEEQDPRVVEQAAGHVHLLALAGGQRAHALQPLLAQADGLDQLVDAAPAILARQAVELAEHPELLADGHIP